MTMHTPLPAAKKATVTSGLQIPSTFWVPGPLYGCLKATEEVLGPDRVWTGTTADQIQFLADYAQGLIDLSQLSTKEFQSKFSFDHNEINKWFKANGFSIELDEFNEGEFGTAAIVRLSAEWNVQGRHLDDFQLQDGKTYPAVEMGSNSWDAYVSSDHPEPIGSISAKNGTTWFLTKATKALDSLELFEFVKTVNGSLQRQSTGILTFPKVEFNIEGDQSIPVGLKTSDKNGRPWVVAQCVQQTKIMMNELGGIAESAAGMGLRSMSAPISKVDVTIDGPAVLWITRPDTQLPIFAVVLSYDSYKDPGTLTFGEAIKK